MGPPPGPGDQGAGAWRTGAQNSDRLPVSGLVANRPIGSKMPPPPLFESTPRELPRITLLDPQPARSVCSKSSVATDQEPGCPRALGPVQPHSDRVARRSRRRRGSHRRAGLRPPMDRQSSPVSAPGLLLGAITGDRPQSRSGPGPGWYRSALPWAGQVVDQAARGMVRAAARLQGCAGLGGAASADGSLGSGPVAKPSPCWW